MSEKTSLEFKPAHRGLGFHPFSEGMPYAPPTPAPTLTPNSGSSPKKLSDSVAGPIRYAPPEAIRGKPLAELQSAIQRKNPSNALGAGYLALRVFAFSIDLITHFSVSLLMLMGVFVIQGHEAVVLFEPGIIELALVFSILMSWALSTAQEVALGSTPGKRLLGLRLEGSAGLLFLRSILFIPSLLFMGSGVLWALLSRDRRCWHDAAVGIQPTRRSSR